jgi:glycosyltransferase involved in cell wall biosynthesis
VVATDVGDLKNIIREGQTGYVLSDNLPQKLAEKIGDTLSKKAPDIEAAREIRSSVTHLGWRNIAELVSMECEKLIFKQTERSKQLQLE